MKPFDFFNRFSASEKAPVRDPHSEHVENRSQLRVAMDDLSRQIEERQAEIGALALGKSLDLPSPEIELFDNTGKKTLITLVTRIEHTLQQQQDQIDIKIYVCPEGTSPDAGYTAVRLYFVQLQEQRDMPAICTGDVFTYGTFKDTGIAKGLISDGEQLVLDSLRCFSKPLGVREVIMRIRDNSVDQIDTKTAWTSKIMTEMPQYREVEDIKGDRTFEQTVKL